MRFVAGRGAVAELLAVSAMAKRMAAPWRRAIGKLLLARAPWRSAIGKLLLARGAAAEHHREAATAGKVSRVTAGKENHCWKGEPLQER